MDITETYKELYNEYLKETVKEKHNMSYFVLWQLKKIDLNNIRNLRIKETE